MKLLLLIFLFFSSINIVFSNIIFFENISLERGKTAQILFLIEDISIGEYPLELELELIFNAYMFEVIGIEDVLPLNNSEFEIRLNGEDLSKSVIKINSTFNTPDNILFILDVTGLASKDSISNLELLNIKVNNEIRNDISLRSGLITLNNLVFDLESSVSEIYPNPFDSYTQIDFDIKQETTLNIKIFDNSARSLNTILGTNAFKISIQDENNNQIEFDDNIKLSIGKYKMTLTPRRTNISIGAYRMIIKLDNDILYRNFIYGG